MCRVHFGRSEERRARVFLEQIGSPHVAAQRVHRLVPAYPEPGAPDVTAPMPPRRWANSERVLRQLLRDPPARLAGGARNVLTWITFGLAVWFSVGALIARLFGAFVSGGRPSWEEKTIRDTSSGARRHLTIFLSLRLYRKRMVVECRFRRRGTRGFPRVPSPVFDGVFRMAWLADQ